MPVASDEQVPKALTYTLMYHFLWCFMFVMSGLALSALFLATGWGAQRALLAPGALYATGLVAGIGSFAAYGVRLNVLLGDCSKDEAFRWSSASSWAVLMLAPILWAAWVLAEPFARGIWNSGQAWAPPEAISSLMFKVEVIVWWLSHLLSVRGLTRGRRLLPAAAQATGGEAAMTGSGDGLQVRPVLAAAGEGQR